MTFVGIDIGTSFIKGADLDVRARTFRHVRRTPFPEPLPGLNPFFFEYDSQEIVRAVDRCVRELIDLAGECDGIVFCNQMHSMVLTGPEGAVRSNCIGWRDQRAQMQHRTADGTYYELYERRLTKEQRVVLGNERPVGTPACSLFWMAEQGLLEPGTVAVALGSFVMSELCGSSPKVDATNAMAYELFNLETGTWHEEVIRALGLKPDNLPPVVKWSEKAGFLEHRGRRVPCYVPVGDYQCALAGAMLRPEDLSLNISTGSQVSRIDDVLRFGNFQSRPFFDDTWTSTITHLPAGRALNVLVDLLTELPARLGVPIADPWTSIVEAAEEAEATDLKVRTSFFPGPRGIRGSIANIGEKNLTAGSLFRAAFEDMAENYFACADKIWPERSWEAIVLSGGLAHKVPLLRQTIEDRFQTKATLCDITEDALSGLLMMAMVLSGDVSSMGQARDEVQAAWRKQA